MKNMSNKMPIARGSLSTKVRCIPPVQAQAGDDGFTLRIVGVDMHPIPPSLRTLSSLITKACIFTQGTFAEAADEAKKQYRFLLVYLHSEQHHSTPQFCRYARRSASIS